jgi:hypothetical protein
MANRAMRARVEERAGGLEPEPFRCEVEHVDLALHDGTLDPCPLVGALRGVEERGLDPVGREGVDLVLHQGDERGDDHPDAVTDERWHLVAE